MYASEDDLKTYLGIASTETDDDELLLQLILASQGMIERRTGRVFEAESNTSRTFDAIDDVDGDTLWFDEDLYSVNSVTNGDGTTVTSAQYVTEPRNRTPYYAIKIRSDASIAWTYSDYPENAITISGKWAYSARPPAEIRQACIRLSSYLFHQKDNALDLDRTFVAGGVTVLPAAIPRDIDIMLHPYIKSYG